MKRMFWFYGIILTGIFLIPSSVLAMHSRMYSSSWQCTHCHPNGAATSPQVPCESCHLNSSGGSYSDYSAPEMANHASAVMASTTYGEWESTCLDCHDPHSVNGFDAWHGGIQDPSHVLVDLDVERAVPDGDEYTFQITGTTVHDQEWADPDTWGNKAGPERGLLFVYNNHGKYYFNNVLRATATSITIKNAFTRFPGPPWVNPFHAQLMYGQFIRDEINGTTVDFSSPTAMAYNESGTEVDPTPDGICQVCHTQTLYWRNDGTGTEHYNGERCTSCHDHTQGFKAESGSEPELFDLVVQKTGDGDGLVTSVGSMNIDCGSDCAETYPAGTAIQLTAAEFEGSSFVGWSGACSGTGNCEITMNGNMQVYAEFVLLPSTDPQLTVHTSGDGSVSSGDGLIDCGADATCSATYQQDDSVTLTANSSTQTFMSWTGAEECLGKQFTCTFVMNGDRDISAVFSDLGEPTAETEPNNSAAGAQAVTLDSMIAGYPDAGGGPDWYFVDITGPETVTVRFDIPSALSYERLLHVQVWQDNGDDSDTMLTEVEVTQGDFDFFNVSLPTAGRYYFVVTNTSGQTDFSYELTLLSNTGPFDPAEEEVNDSLAAANVLEFDLTMNGALMRIDDEDWFEVITDVDRTATLVFSGISEDARGDWEVIVYSNGDTPQDQVARLEVKEGSELNIAMPVSGSPYYIMVRDMYRSENSTFYNVTPYRLTVRSNDGQDVPIAEQEPNDTLGLDATDAGALDTSMSGQLFVSSDTDWYRFTGTAGASVRVSFSTMEPSNQALWYFSLHDSAGTQRGGTYGGSAGQNFTYTLPEAGDYYIQVNIPAGFSQYYSSSQYVITVEAQ